MYGTSSDIEKGKKKMCGLCKPLSYSKSVCPNKTMCLDIVGLWYYYYHMKTGLRIGISTKKLHVFRRLTIDTKHIFNFPRLYYYKTTATNTTSTNRFTRGLTIRLHL